MKKLLLFIPLVIACSNDDPSDSNNYNEVFDCNEFIVENNGGLVLVSSVSQANSNNPENVVVTSYNYDGNKVVSRNVQNFYNDELTYIENYSFIYNNNQITSIEKGTTNPTNNEFELEKLYEYDYNSQGLISEYRRFNCDDNICVIDAVYSYSCNSSGQIFYNRLMEDGVNTDGTVSLYFTLDSSGNIVYMDGLIQQNDNPNCSTVIEYDYDNYNNPFKNITGRIPFLGYISSEYNINALNNNWTAYNHQNAGDCETMNYTATGSCSYVYNDAGYPINKTCQIIQNTTQDANEVYISYEYLD